MAKNSKALTTTSVKCGTEIIEKAVNALVEGKKFLPVPTHNNPPHGFNAANQYGFALLREALFTMNAFERNFAASMTSANALSDKQRSCLKKIVLLHLGIDIDPQEHVEPSAYNDNKKTTTRKAA